MLFGGNWHCMLIFWKISYYAYAVDSLLFSFFMELVFAKPVSPTGFWLSHDLFDFMKIQI